MKKLFFVLVIIFAGISVQAQTVFEVTNTNDSGSGSLRQAMLDGKAADPYGFVHIRFNLPTSSL